MGQCTPTLHAKLDNHNEGDTTFEEAQEEIDPVKLLKCIKSAIFDFQDRKYIVTAVSDLQQNFFKFKQPQGLSLPEYKERYKDLIYTIKSHKLNLGKDQIMVEELDNEWEDLDEEEQTLEA